MEPRVPLANLKPVPHGGLRERELRAMGVDPRNVVDFSANLNPYGPPPSVRRALQRAVDEVRRYPEPRGEGLEERLADRLGCAPREVLVGAGITGLLVLAAHAYVGPGRAGMVPDPTYGEYAVAVRASGGTATRVPGPDLGMDPGGLADAVRRESVVFLCNPNNPTGEYLGKAAVRQVLAACEEMDGLLVLDEAFWDFVPEAHDWSEEARGSGHLLLLRSFTKTFAIPGVRVGYALGSEDLLEPLRRLRPPWTVDTFGQAAARAALDAGSFVRESRERLWQNRQALEEKLRVRPSQANFFLLRTGDGATTRRRLLRHGVLVRDCASFGLPEWVRFAVRRPAENRRLLAALEAEAPRALRDG